MNDSLVYTLTLSISSGSRKQQFFDNQGKGFIMKQQSFDNQGKGFIMREKRYFKWISKSGH